MKDLNRLKVVLVEQKKTEIYANFRKSFPKFVNTKLH